MIPITILSFAGLFSAFQFLTITIGHVFNINTASGVQVGLMIGAVYGAMMTSVSAFGRAPTRRENWALSVSVNLCAFVISIAFLSATLYATGGTYALEEFIMFLSDVPVEALLIGLAVAFLVQTALCLLIFGIAARRHLSRVGAGKAKAKA
jgi:hypothetical protein